MNEGFATQTFDNWLKFLLFLPNFYDSLESFIEVVDLKRNLKFDETKMKWILSLHVNAVTYDIVDVFHSFH